MSDYAKKRVLLTGHTGFKGAWLAIWLESLGAEVTGYALAPPPGPNLYRDAELESTMRSILADIRDLERLRAVVRETKPDYVFHLAAQALVRESYADPIGTIETNITGTANVLDAIRTEGVKPAIVVVTSDKCYENRETGVPCREEDALGGHDPYSMSKAGAELVSDSYRRSFFKEGPPLATARAGNAIGGGDFGRDRLLPDIMLALHEKKPIRVRNPRSIRPWQHLLEPLSGYLRLGTALIEAPARHARAYNFGPDPKASAPVREVVEKAIAAYGEGTWIDASDPNAPHEAATLNLAIDRAQRELGWSPRWELARAIEATVEWSRAYFAGARGSALRDLCRAQISAYAAR